MQGGCGCAGQRPGDGAPAAWCGGAAARPLHTLRCRPAHPFLPQTTSERGAEYCRRKIEFVRERLDEIGEAREGDEGSRG